MRIRCVSVKRKKTSAVSSDGGGAKCRSGVRKLTTMWGSCPGNVQLGRLRARTVVRREEIHYFISFLHGHGVIFFSPSYAEVCAVLLLPVLWGNLMMQMTRTSRWWSRQNRVLISLQYQITRIMNTPVETQPLFLDSAIRVYMLIQFLATLPLLSASFRTPTHFTRNRGDAQALALIPYQLLSAPTGRAGRQEDYIKTLEWNA